MLTVTQADAILERALTPHIAPAGFVFAGKRTWARTIKPHICELVRFFRTKGAGITPIWGVALDFVPQVASSGLKWKRSRQDLYFDLEWHPVDYDETYRARAEAWHRRLMESGPTLKMELPNITQAEKWYVNLLDSLDVFEAGAASLVKLTASEAITFFDEIISLADVAKLLAFQRTYPYQGLGFFNHVQPPLAYAFLLARLARRDEARSSYVEYWEKIQPNESVRPKLDSAFAEAISSPL
jgi:hypothetical protein